MHRDAHLPRRGGHFLSGRRAGRVCDLIGCRPDWNVLWKSVSAMVSRTLRFHGPTLWPYYLDPLMDLAPEGFLSNVSVKNLSKGYDPGRSLARSVRSSVSAAEMSLGLIYTAVYTGLVIACIWLTQQPHKHTHTHQSVFFFTELKPCWGWAGLYNHSMSSDTVGTKRQKLFFQLI